MARGRCCSTPTAGASPTRSSSTGSATGIWSAVLQTKLIFPGSEFQLNINHGSNSTDNPFAVQSGDFQVNVGQLNTIQLLMHTDASVLPFSISDNLPSTSSLDAFSSGHLTIDALGATIVTASGHDYSSTAAVPVPVPGPGAFTLMLSGLGLLGSMACRRLKK